MTAAHIRPLDLAARWDMSTGTLENWRCEGRGPTYIKIGKRVLYAVADIEAFEEVNKVDPVE